MGQEVMRCYKQRLTLRLFDFFANDGVDIIAFGAWTFAKRVEVSCASPVTFKDPMNRPGSSQSNKFAEQIHLIDWQEGSKRQTWRENRLFTGD